MTHEHGGTSPEGMQNQEGLVGLTEEERQYLQEQYNSSGGKLAELKAEYQKVRAEIAELAQGIAEEQRGQFKGPLRIKDEMHLEVLYESQKAGLEVQSQQLAARIAELERELENLNAKLAA